jgi:alkyl hydroperoxide reductase subunit F
LKADTVTQEKLKANSKVEIIVSAETLAIVGDPDSAAAETGRQFVSGLRYKDLISGAEKELKLDGVFVEIGAVPNSDIVKELVELNKFGEVVVDHKTQQTSNPGIWAVGDVSDVRYKQNNISAGDAVKAVLNIYERISKT